jgi:conjugal transfer pilus assembly protein TraA
MVLVGIVCGVARQSLMAFALGTGGGMGLYNAYDLARSLILFTSDTAFLNLSFIQDLP